MARIVAGFVCCGMPPAVLPLFEPDDLPATPSASDRSLAIRSAPGRPLGKEDRAFNRALASVQALTRALDDETRRLDRLLVFHAAKVRPRMDQAAALRTSLVRALAPFLDDRRLTKTQHRVLRQVLIEQLDEVLASVEKPGPELQALFEQLHGVSYAQAVRDDLEEVRAGMAAMFDDLGLDIDVPELGADMTEADAAVAAAHLADELRRAEESRPAKPTARHGKAARAAEERARRSEQLRKDTLGGVYRRLVKELHPDLEPNAAERERKSRIMQDVTAAHGRGDLLALLKLEIEWLDPAADAARLSRDTLQAYTALLKEQAGELQADIDALRFHPRYAPLIADGPFGLPMVIDGPREVAQLDDAIVQLRHAVERLSSSEALEEVRGAIREYRDSEKRRTRSRRR